MDEPGLPLRAFLIERVGSASLCRFGYTAIMRPELLYTWLACGLTAALMVWVGLRRR
ncbi:MAG TPA: hypothetical protein VN747_08200 [Burkholderiales bacterium]|nr:hypothetical protein [Burkholderiales bacterium]